MKEAYLSYKENFMKNFHSGLPVFFTGERIDLKKVNKLKECYSKSLDKHCYVENKYDDNIFINFINLLG